MYFGVARVVARVPVLLLGVGVWRSVVSNAGVFCRYAQLASSE